MRRTLFYASVLRIGLLFLLLGGMLAGAVWAQPPAPQPVSHLQAVAGTVTTAFGYQGRLMSGGSPANGAYDFRFSLYDAESGGQQVGSTVTMEDVPVSNGEFQVILDFGNVFDGTALWLEIAVRPGDSNGAYTTLSPRQPLLAVPYAQALPGLWIQYNSVSPNIIGGHSNNNVSDGVVGATITGGGAPNTSLPFNHANRVTDSYGVVVGGDSNQAGNGDEDPENALYATVVGGTGNQAVGPSAFVGGGGYYHDMEGWHREGNIADGDASVVVGGVGNRTTRGMAFIGGGSGNVASSYFSVVTGGTINRASGHASFVGGGMGNRAGMEYSFIGGGDSNTVEGGYTDKNAAICGGRFNKAQKTGTFVGGGERNTTSGAYATVSGGYHNTAGGAYATVGGGATNSASASYATIGGGYRNTASGSRATIAGGERNTAGGYLATIGGGFNNRATGDRSVVAGGVNNTASGAWATVPGGSGNVAAGDYSFAAGRRAKADHNGSFVLADATNADFHSSWENQFRARFTGGFTFVVDPNVRYWVRFRKQSSSLIQTSTGAYLSLGGTWTNASDRALKEDFTPVDAQEVLERLAHLPLYTWRYKAEEEQVRHMGPTGQDFYAAFGLGADDRHIATVDADGVALAAIQALYQMAQEQNARIAQLERENQALRARLQALEAQQTGTAGR